jgi:hypothetical protein
VNDRVAADRVARHHNMLYPSYKEA